MIGLRGAPAVFALLCAIISTPSFGQNKADNGLAVGRQMLAEDNPGELWIDRGKQLFHEKRGTRNASLEQCDFGLGAGKLEGASVAVATPDHYFPFMYPLGAAGAGERAQTIHEGFQSGTLSMRCVQFG